MTTIDLSTILPLIFWGLYFGCVYALLATGLNVIFGVMKIVNFAHGELMMMGAYATYWISTLFGANPYLAILASASAVAVLGAVIRRLCFKPIATTGKLNEIFVSVALIFILQNVAASLWKSDDRKILSPYESSWLNMGSFNLPLDYVTTIALTAAILLGLFSFLKMTWLGRALRATSQNRIGAMLMGINVEKMDTVSFSLGCALAAVAGSILGMLSFNPYMGTLPCIKSFVVIILGGLGSIPGAIISSLLVGLTESMAALFLGGAWKTAAVFVIFVIVLAFRPTGIFGGAAE